MKTKKPVAKFIHRKIDREIIAARVPTELIAKIEQAAAKLNTSKAGLLEAALEFYIQSLEKEGSI